MNWLSSPLARLHGWDRALCVTCNLGLRNRAVHQGFRAVSRLGDGVFWYTLMFALVSVQGRAAVPGVGRMLLAGGSCTLLYKWMKAKTSRPRPYETHPEVQCGIAPLDRYSFPSGHTLHAVAFSVAAIAVWGWLAWLLIPVTLLIALSRVVLGLHYPSDVLVGATVGAVVATAWLHILPL